MTDIRMDVPYYLSGPMSYRLDWNKHAFAAYAEALRAAGLTIINPAESAGGVTNLKREWYLELDYHLVSVSGGVILMPGWRDSDGAKREALFADSLGIPLYEIQLEGRAGDITLVSVFIDGCDIRTHYDDALDAWEADPDVIEITFDPIWNV